MTVYRYSFKYVNFIDSGVIFETLRARNNDKFLRSTSKYAWKCVNKTIGDVHYAQK